MLLKMKALIKTLIIITSIIFIASMIMLAQPNIVEVDGHKYQRVFDHSARCMMIHVDDCGCWTKLNDKPN